MFSVLRRCNYNFFFPAVMMFAFCLCWNLGTANMWSLTWPWQSYCRSLASTVLWCARSVWICNVLIIYITLKVTVLLMYRRYLESGLLQATNQRLWLGLRDHTDTDQFVTFTGESGWYDWGHEEPDPDHNQPCVILWDDKKWSDKQCFVTKTTPAPLCQRPSKREKISYCFIS